MSRIRGVSSRWFLLPAATVFAAALLLLTISLRPARASGAELGLGGRFQVRQVEAGYRLEEDSLRVRLHLTSGLAVEHTTREAHDIERILAMLRLHAAGRARLFVEMEGDSVKAFQVSLP